MNGRGSRLSTSSRRKSAVFISVIGIMYESNSIFLKSESSYDQYHWCPIDFTDNSGKLISSSKYSNRSDGSAMKIRVTAGAIVQISSIVCPSSKNRLMYLLKNNIIMIYVTIRVIISKIIMAWS